MKLGHILAQHLKKGMEGLEEILEQEMQQAQEERIELARKKGEETGVKFMVVLIGLVLIFKSQLTSLIGTIFEKITSQSGSI